MRKSRFTEEQIALALRQGDAGVQGATAKAIQELAGHQDLATTQRYMHLSPAHKDAAIRLLDRRPPRHLETARRRGRLSNRSRRTSSS